MRAWFRRIEEFIGSPKVVEALQQAFAQARRAQRPRAVAVEADAGMGKSHLLSGLHLILASEREAAGLCIVRIIDLSDTNTRSPNAIQRRIIEGLTYTDAPQPYRFPPSRVTRAFLEYNEKDKELQARRSALSIAEIRQYQQELGALFTKGYRTLANERTIVLRFDTTEALVSLQPDHGLGEVGQTSAELFYAWIETVLTQLPNTLVVFCGRPVRLSEAFVEGGFKLRMVGRKVTEVLQQVGLLFGDVQELKALNEDGVAAYLRAYDEPPRDAEHARQVLGQTDGMPLLITCLIEDWRFPGQLQSAPADRASFEQKILEFLLNPLRADADPERQLFQYALYVLSYARRGIQREQLRQFLVEYGFTEDPLNQRAALTNEQIDAVLEQMEQMTLIKRRPGTALLYLHDHFYSLIDTSGRAKALGLREEVLEFLIRDAEQRLESAEGRRLRSTALSDLVYYLFVANPPRGYRAYLTATHQLFEENEINSALILRDELWQWLSIGQNRDLIRPTTLKLVEVVRDDGVWLARYYWRTGNHDRAVEVAKQVRQLYDLVAPEEGGDPYFVATLYTILGTALTLQQDVTPEDAETLFQRSITILNTPTWQDTYLNQHRDFLLAGVCTAAGYLETTLSRYEQAVIYNRQASDAYSRYRPPEEEPLPRFNLDEPVSQLALNTAFCEVQLGNYVRAQKQLDTYIFESQDGQPPRLERLTIDRQALAYNVLSILQLEMGNLEAAERSSVMALDLARNAARKRTFALVLMHRAAVLHERMKRNGVYDDSPLGLFEEAAAIFANEASSLRELNLHWNKYERGFGEHLLARGESAQAERRLIRALERADEAIRVAGLKAEAGKPFSPSLQATEMLHSKAVVYRLLGEKEEGRQLLDQAAAMMASAAMPWYGHIVAGSIAYEYAQHAREDGDLADMLGHSLVALARAFVFSPENRTVTAFKRRFTKEFATLNSAQIQQLTEVLSADGNTFLAHERLAHQQPPLKGWLAAAMRSSQFFENLLMQLSDL